VAPVCVENPSSFSRPLGPRPGLGNTSAIPLFLFPNPTGSGRVIFGKNHLGVPLPKQIRLGPLGSSWIPEGPGLS